ncbi:hypothetical protein ACKWMY_17090 [Serratia sp. J2]|uniref:hypothetical protein n=1 Tax=Serratia sp. J2 TaxID=3386551 RepID=UPI0039170448
MRVSIDRTNGITLVIILSLNSILIAVLFNGATELVMCVATTLIGSLLGMAGRIVYESVTFKDVMLERTICTLLPLLSGWALFVVTKSNVGGLNEMLLVLSTLLAIGVAGACLNNNMPLPDDNALYFGIALMVMSVVAMTYRLNVPEYYWYAWIGVTMAMMSLSGVLIKGDIVKRFRADNAES